MKYKKMKKELLVGLGVATLATVGYFAPSLYTKVNDQFLREHLKEMRLENKMLKPNLSEDYKIHLDQSIKAVQTVEGYTLLITGEKWCPPCQHLKQYSAERDLTPDSTIVIDDPAIQPLQTLYVQRKLKINGITITGFPSIFKNQNDTITDYVGFNSEEHTMRNKATGEKVKLETILKKH